MYGSRQLVQTVYSNEAIEKSVKLGHQTVKVLSYNVMRQLHSTPYYKPYCDPSILTATRRKEQLLEEIISYNADVLCLQEVDDFTLWWVPRLNAAGYDSVYHQRTGEYDDGLVIAFRRMLFQIFHTLRVNFNDMCQLDDVVNDAHLTAKFQQDNIALIVALQPWEKCAFPSALCIANLQLASHPDNEFIRLRQVQYFLPLLEQFNTDFQLPMIVCGSFNSTPSSDVYHIMRTGRPRPRPEPPKRMERPRVVCPTTSTLTVQWDLVLPSLDGPVLAYRVDRRVNGSTTVGFTQEVILDNPMQNELKVTMLSAGATYEFRVAAKNKAGWGEYSAPSLPVETLRARLQVDHSKPPVVVPFEPPRFNPFQTSYGSGKTPRFTDGAIRLDLCPRPLHAASASEIYETLQARGDREDKLLHFEVFQSAYGKSFEESEPDFTFSDHVFVGTIDYIFYSKKELIATEILSLPLLESLDGDDERESALVPDIEYSNCMPKRWDSAPRLHGGQLNPNYSGEWTTQVLQVPNPKRKHHWLPNALFSSDHLALMAVLTFCDDVIPIGWN